MNTLEGTIFTVLTICFFCGWFFRAILQDKKMRWKVGGLMLAIYLIGGAAILIGHLLQ